MFNKIIKWWGAKYSPTIEEAEFIEEPATPKIYIEHRPVAGVYVIKVECVVWSLHGNGYKVERFISKDGHVCKTENKNTSFNTEEEAMLAIAKYKELTHGVGVTRTEIK